jgi:hypothetical protein
MKAELQKTVEAIKERNTASVTGHDMHLLLKAINDVDIYEGNK